MNWTIFSVLAAIAILVPSALWATCKSTADKYQYEQHYGPAGFSPEVAADREAKGQSPSENAEGTRPSTNVDVLGFPLSEWPSEL